MNRLFKVGGMLALPLLIVAAAVTGGLVFTAATPTPASASCIAPTTQGDWRNINANTNAMTRAVVTFECGDVILCDTNGNCTGGQSTYRVRMFGRCHPTDCDWGTVVATNRADGWLLATYHFGFKTSYVWLKTYVYSGITYLRVYVDNRFAPGDGRANYVTDEWFRK